MAPRPDFRARDIDRALTATVLDSAYADGQLTFDEHRLRSERARVAITLRDLRRLVSDLQIDVDLPEPPPRTSEPKNRLLLALGSVVIVTVGLVVFLSTRTGEQPVPTAAVVASTSTRSVTPTVPMDLPVDVTPIVARPFVFDTAAGLDDFRERYVQRFGSSQVLEVFIQMDSNRADVYRPTAEGRRERVFVSGGFEVYHETDAPDAQEALFDWATIDSAVLAGLVAGTPEAVGVPDAAVEYVMITDSRGEQRISITAKNDDDQGGRVEADFAGNIVSVSR
ncbi:DUF1707 domain-containing protein [Rhodococcus fascians]|uniref:DUF1707 SHOCT-like domain-containing protein n=1 Tax=Nocardiaceae TaxID=85025 RepID=UPI0019D2DD06|nr:MULTISPECIES: DUF1707 domain-containing protein [Rhodococcus]MBW4779865.1 DUF1707 domain-containing protein [Rhodococcus fascians]MDJ0002356.1 DUF1707 domain-containing protein [Rhodococcus fascians]